MVSERETIAASSPCAALRTGIEKNARHLTALAWFLFLNRREFHARCRAAFEALWLQTFFAHAAGLVREVAAGGGGGGRVAAAALQVMGTVLSWDFRKGGARHLAATTPPSLPNPLAYH